MGRLGALLDLSDAVLEVSWALLGLSWAVLGASEALLGLTWAENGPKIAELRASRPAPARKRKERFRFRTEIAHTTVRTGSLSWAVLERSGSHREPYWAVLGPKLREP